MLQLAEHNTEVTEIVHCYQYYDDDENLKYMATMSILITILIQSYNVSCNNNKTVINLLNKILIGHYCIVLIVLTSGVQLRTKCLVSLCTRRYFIGDENGTRGHASVCGGAEL